MLKPRKSKLQKMVEEKINCPQKVILDEETSDFEEEDILFERKKPGKSNVRIHIHKMHPNNKFLGEDGWGNDENISETDRTILTAHPMRDVDQTFFGDGSDDEYYSDDEDYERRGRRRRKRRHSIGVTDKSVCEKMNIREIVKKEIEFNKTKSRFRLCMKRMWKCVLCCTDFPLRCCRPFRWVVRGAEKRFGTGIASFYDLWVWIIYMNIGIFCINLFFLIIPWLLRSDYEPERKWGPFFTLDFYLGLMGLRSSEIGVTFFFYGGYTAAINETGNVTTNSLNQTMEYPAPMEHAFETKLLYLVPYDFRFYYPLCILLCFLLSFILLVASIGKRLRTVSRMDREMKYSTAVLSLWDHSLTRKVAVQNLKQSISTTLLEYMRWDKEKKVERRTACFGLISIRKRRKKKKKKRSRKDIGGEDEEIIPENSDDEGDGDDDSPKEKKKKKINPDDYSEKVQNEAEKGFSKAKLEEFVLEGRNIYEEYLDYKASQGLCGCLRNLDFKKHLDDLVEDLQEGMEDVVDEAAGGPEGGASMEDDDLDEPDDKKCCLILCRLNGWLSTALIVIGAPISVYFIYDNYNSLNRNFKWTSTIILSSMSNVLPKILDLYVNLEQYNSQKVIFYNKTIRTYIVKNAMLIFSIIRIFYSSSVKEDCEIGGQECCPPTEAGVMFWQLIITNTVMSLIGNVFSNCCMLVIKRSRHKNELNISGALNKVLYAQTIIWVGSIVSPMLPLLGVISSIILFNARYIVMRYTMGFPKSPIANASRNVFNQVMLLITLVISFIPSVAFFSRGAFYCGPAWTDSLWKGLKIWEKSPYYWIRDTFDSIFDYTAQGLAIGFLFTCVLAYIMYQRYSNYRLRFENLLYRMREERKLIESWENEREARAKRKKYL